MAQFLPAYKKTMGDEGGCSFNPHDRGNVVVNGKVTIPTYKGISPVYWGTWSGFVLVRAAIISASKRPEYGSEAFDTWVHDIDRALGSNVLLQEQVQIFYKRYFWQANRLDDIDDQTVATWLFNHEVNCGSLGTKWMQVAAGVSNDGIVGPHTVEAINSADPIELLKKAIDLAIAHRIAVVRKDPKQKQFLKSWLRRDGVSEARIKEIFLEVM
jgi:lysozyme family protein